MSTFFTVIHVLLCVFMIFVILLQPGKDAGMGAALGGGAATSAFGGRGAVTFLSKLTAVCAGLFFLTSLGLSFVGRAGLGDRAACEGGGEAAPAKRRLLPRVGPVAGPAPKASDAEPARPLRRRRPGPRCARAEVADPAAGVRGSRAVHDGLLVLVWSAVFAGGLGACLWLSGRGLPRTYVRDVLHVGAGVWPLGWKAWHSPWPPVLVALTGFGLLLAVPMLGRRVAAARALERAVSGEGEAWSGLVLYGLSAAGVHRGGVPRQRSVPRGGGPARAGAGRRDRRPGGPARGGSTVTACRGRRRRASKGRWCVALLAAVGTAMAALLFGVPLSRGRVLGAGLAAAVAEAVAPRATDNLLVPLAVWLVAGGLESGWGSLIRRRSSFKPRWWNW